MKYIRPHSSEWFEKLLLESPEQAAQTARLIELAGREDICSICGDEESADYQPVDEAKLPLRLCKSCLRMQRERFGLNVNPVR